MYKTNPKKITLLIKNANPMTPRMVALKSNPAKPKIQKATSNKNIAITTSKIC